MSLLEHPVSQGSSSLREISKSVQRAISQIAKKGNDIKRNNEDWEALTGVIRSFASLISACPLPTNLLEEISRQTISIFNKLFDESDESSFVNHASKERADQVAQILMKFIFNDAREVLQISAFKTAGKRYVISNLASTPKIEVLRIYADFPPTLCTELKNNIHYLPNLLVVEVPSKCSDVIIEEISNHCPNVETLIVKHSEEVTDQSVPYLQKLKKLVNLNVKSTGMSTEGYRRVLEARPCIDNINWDQSFITELLDGMTPEILNNKIKITCELNSPRVLVDKCPNVRTLTIGVSHTTELYPLTELKELKQLSIKGGHFHIGQENDIFEENGKNLESLRLQSVHLCCIDSIIRYCVSLKTLKIEWCNIWEIENTELLSEMPHFISLRELTLENNTGGRSYCQLLRNYVNLKGLIIINRRNFQSYFNHEYFENALRGGCFKSLEDFQYENCNYLTIRTARKLIEKCPNLTFLSTLSTWGRVTQDDIATLKEEIKLKNYDIEVY